MQDLIDSLKYAVQNVSVPASVLVSSTALKALLAENERLRGVVDRLPKTADGVAVVPESEVWYPPHMFRSWEVDYADAIWMVHINPDGKGNEWFGVGVDKCYSTRESALNAKGGEDGQ